MLARRLQRHELAPWRQFDDPGPTVAHDSHGFMELVEEGVDVALRLGAELPQNVIGRHLAVAPRCLVASQACLERRGTSQYPDQLASHDFVRFAWLQGSND
jgi:DNA-binding transcriptional LysR family regulator